MRRCDDADRHHEGDRLDEREVTARDRGEQQRTEPENPPADPAGSGTDGVVEFDERRAKMERLRAEGIDPYPPVTLWETRTRIADFSEPLMFTWLTPETWLKRWPMTVSA